MNNITMKEIARLANVSQPTVSRVINGKKGVSEDIVKKVMQVIEDVGYTPNTVAQSLKRNRSKIIGVCVTEIYNPYFVELIDTLELESRKKGYNIIFHNSKHNPITEWENIQNFLARQVDGIIIVPTSNYNMKKINKLNTPTVVITQLIENIDSVGLNHLKSGRIASEYFIRAGHKKFGFIGTMPDDKFIGYESMLYENGFQFNKKDYIQTHENSTNSYLMQRDIAKYFATVDTLDFTCIFAANDILALEFIKAAQERGLKIPQDISVIGFDDTYLSKIMGISSIHQPIEEMVKTTFEILLDRIENTAHSEFVHVQMEPTLIERNSSKVIKK